jgi:hypothetical protein
MEACRGWDSRRTTLRILNVVVERATSPGRGERVAGEQRRRDVSGGPAPRAHPHSVGATSRARCCRARCGSCRRVVHIRRSHPQLGRTPLRGRCAGLASPAWRPDRIRAAGGGAGPAAGRPGGPAARAAGGARRRVTWRTVYVAVSAALDAAFRDAATRQDKKHRRISIPKDLEQYD